MDIEALQAALMGSRTVRVLRSCASTNMVARELVAEHGPGTLVVAEHQTAGRGRQGRSWQAEGGKNLLWSLVICPNVPVQRAPRCVLVWAAAMAEVLDVQLKWPNDLVDSKGRKLGGILAELVDSVPHVVLGVGINVNQRVFKGLPNATSLALKRGLEAGGVPIDRIALLVRLVHAVEAADVCAADGLDRWRARAITLGQNVRVGSVEGVARALRDDGALIVGDKAILAGDVEIV
jgi:BirA family biotin operon repressor/biotin-[acetyl-CoA-carboxylase] ligase